MGTSRIKQKHIRATYSYDEIRDVLVNHRRRTILLPSGYQVKLTKILRMMIDVMKAGDLPQCYYCGARLSSFVEAVNIHKDNESFSILRGLTDTQYALTVDHVVPRSRGGCNYSSNRVIACDLCNETKGSDSVEEFLNKIPLT